MPFILIKIHHQNDKIIDRILKSVKMLFLLCILLINSSVAYKHNQEHLCDHKHPKAHDVSRHSTFIF